jgi:hypothetical protein
MQLELFYSLFLDSYSKTSIHLLFPLSTILFSFLVYLLLFDANDGGGGVLSAAAVLRCCVMAQLVWHVVTFCVEVPSFLFLLLFLCVCVRVFVCCLTTVRLHVRRLPSHRKIGAHVLSILFLLLLLHLSEHVMSLSPTPLIYFYLFSVLRCCCFAKKGKEEKPPSPAVRVWGGGGGYAYDKRAN